MTTNVTITTHDWAVEVQPIDPKLGTALTEQRTTRVEPHSTHREAIWDTKALRIAELPREVAIPLS